MTLLYAGRRVRGRRRLVEQIVLQLECQISVDLRRQWQPHYQRHDVAVLRRDAQLAADHGSTGAEESVRLGGHGPHGRQEPLDVVSLAGQRQPALVTQLPAGVDQKRSRREFAVPCQPTQRRVAD